MAMIAQDNFVGEVDGAPISVQKGQVFPDKHAVVKLDAGRGVLFRKLEEEPDPPKKPSRRSPASKDEDS